jgi:hypothetical protein
MTAVLIAVDTDDLALWEDGAGVRVDQSLDAHHGWRLAHRWVCSRNRARTVHRQICLRRRTLVLLRNRPDQVAMLDPFEQVFQLEIDDGTAVVRLSGPARKTSPVRAEAIRQQTAAVFPMAGNDDGC